MENNNILAIPKTICTGCFTCYSLCPTKAISMAFDEEGFSYPIVDSTACIKCGLCYKKCPVAESNVNRECIYIFRGNAKDLVERRKGSSGGIFGLLSNYIISIGGIIYGAVYSAESKLIIHSNNKKTDITRIYTSKYVQSQIGDCFIEIKQLMNDNKTVLFCGTPCQVAGLKSYLGKDNANLFTIDFMCHGVPSSGLFRDYINDLESTRKLSISDVSFRTKKNGWRNSTTSIVFSDGSIMDIQNKDFIFYRCFLKSFSLRKSCYGCTYYRSHESDLTLADDWQLPSELDDDTGMSLILVNTEHGMNLLKQIMKDINIMNIPIGSFDFEKYKHNYEHQERDKFFKDYKEQGAILTLDKWKKRALKQNSSFRDRLFGNVQCFINRISNTNK
jgi:coenzyme F420-reducing hydrogenase beta subunit